VKAEFTRHEKYHRETYFDAIQLLGVNDVTARTNSLLSDGVDAIADPDPKTIELLRGAPSMVVGQVPSGTQVTFDMDCSAGPFNNVDVRLALKYAMNRKEIVEKIASGFGTIGNDHPIAPNIPYYAALEQREYDPDKAKFHLKKAGAEGLAVQLSLSDAVYPGAVDMGNLYQQSATAAGIKVDIIREPVDSYWSNVWLKKPFFGSNYGQRATPDMVFSTFYRDGAPWNATKWQNARFQELLLAAKSELDTSKRGAMYAEMQQLCRDDGGTILAFFQNFLWAAHERVKHGESVSSEWQLDGGRAYHRWWFDA
jgi:peptide/nickel transport system substrate-binding protein